MKFAPGLLRCLFLLAPALVGLAILTARSTALAQPGAASPVRISAAPSQTQAAPGAHLVVAIVLDHAERWHTWPSAAQDVLPRAVAEFALRTEITLSGARPDWISAVGPVQWPVPSPSRVADPTGQSATIELPTYAGRAVAYLPLQVAENAPLGAHTLAVDVFFQACDEKSCLQPTTEVVSVAIEVVALGAAASAAPDPALFGAFDPSVFSRMLAGTVAPTLGAGAAKAVRFDAFGWEFSVDPGRAPGFALLLLTAALGGFLLNLTPCVLPVIPIKIMGLSQSAGHPRRALLLGAVMSAGVVAFWMTIGLAIAFISGFSAISSLFQTSYFAIIVGAFIALMAVGMLGLFTVRLPRAVYMVNPSHDTVPGSFVFGAMTAILSTPCTAPFMGSAAAWAATQREPIVLATFAAIGLGMALPYLILSANPKWVEKVPRTGPASEVVKQVIGLLLLAVATFFLGTGLAPLFADTGRSPSQTYWWLVAAFLVVAMGWLVVRTFQITKRRPRRAVIAALGLLLGASAIAGAARFTAKSPIDWVVYDRAVFDAARARGDVVLVDFTADWCLNCKVLEHTVLYSDAVVHAVREGRVIALKIDLTRDNPQGKAMLKEVGRVAIPLLAVFGPGLPEPFLSDAYTPDQVVDALREARGP